jgi:bacillithiol biosynthesis cysteine-adding enzyme BshC
MSFTKEYINYKKARFPKLFTDYIDGEKSLAPFYNQYPSIENFNKIIAEAAKYNFNRDIVTEELIARNKNHFDMQPKLQAAIKSLKDKNTFTICTGHQLCLFGGPLYFIYKIATAISLAKELKHKYTDYNFVPVFWMATEDHDFEEVNHFHLFGRSLKWNTAAKGAVGRMSTDGLEKIFADFCELIKGNANAEDLKKYFADAYLAGKNLSEATRQFVYSLFPDSDLVIIDADNRKLKSLFVTEMKNDILQRQNEKQIAATTLALEKLGYEKQISAREINFFYLDNNLRERIIYNDETKKYDVLNSTLSFTETELSGLIESSPEKFSPNVALRPVYQQTVLPNLVYIGGAAEISYWLQLKSAFDLNQTLFPILFPRKSLMMIEKKWAEKIAKLDLVWSDFFEEQSAINKKYLAKKSDATISLEKYNDELKIVYNSLVEKISSIDKTLKAAIEAEHQKSISGLKNIESKVNKSLKLQYENSISQISKIKENLFPGGAMQERTNNFSSLYLNYGSGFINTVSELSSFDFRVTVLNEA